MIESSENIFEAIFQSCEEGIVSVDKTGKIILANKAAHKIFGYEENELIGLYVEQLLPQSIREQHVQDRQKYGENPSPRKMGYGRDLFGKKKNDTIFNVEVSLNQAPINGTTHTVAFIIDITARKKIEKALKDSEEQLILYATELENRVKQRTEELDKSIKELEGQVLVRKKAEFEAKNALSRQKELNELKSRFVSMASHEFRTPLSTILSSASLIEKYKTAETQEKRDRHILKIKSSIKNLNNILDDFLSLSKLEEGKISLDRVEVDVLELVSDITEELSPIMKKDQTIDITSKGNPQNITTDVNILKNICINLISNAIKYSESGQPILIDMDFNERLHMKVTDKGMGIPEADQKHMFERFFRAKNAVNIQGTGLGLNIVKKYIELLEGEISFESELNKGTTFYINLPIH